jgi:signal transduction histidine kinase/CheY-like chemotaxis protein
MSGRHRGFCVPLTRKTILALSVWLALTVMSLLALTKLVINKGFAEVELVQARRNVLRTANALEQGYEDLATKLGDWAFWDDTYAFVEDANRNYQSSNLNDESQDTALNDLIVLHNHSGRMLWGRIRIGDQWQNISDTAYQEVLQFTSRITPLPEGNQSQVRIQRAILRLGDDAFLITAAPVLSSKHEGPSQGVLIFGRSVQRTMPKAIARTVALPTSTISTDELDERKAAGEPRIHRLREAPLESWYEACDDNHALLYILLRDNSGDPVLVARVEIPREATHIGSQAVRLFLGLLSVSGIVLTGLAAFGMYYFLLRRVGSLSREVNRISASGDTAARVHARGSDEISLLACRINQLLTTLQSQEHKLADWAMQLDAARSAAIDSNHAKSAFLANMSHEIRTPMTAILGFADLVIDPEGRPAELDVQRESVSTIKRNAEHLLTVINDILDISKIEAGKMTVESIDCPPSILIEEVRDLMSVRAAAKKLALNVEFDGLLPKTIVSDPVRFRQILFNLIGNAIKFTPPPPESEGWICVRTRCEHVGSPLARLCVDVTDTGVGINDDLFDRLFDPFVQADPSSTRRYGGTGLGLTISRKLARMLGGDLECIRPTDDRPGTTFRFWIPIAANAEMIDLSKPEYTSPEYAPCAQLHAVSGRILLAEDGLDNQRLVSHLLRKAGAEVEIAPDGAKALRAVLNAQRSLEGQFDLLLLDMQMPEKDGYEVASELRARGIGLPIVALTAHAMAGDRERCIAAGCSDYLTKPVDRVTLIAACRHWIRAGRTARSAIPEAVSKGKGG